MELKPIEEIQMQEQPQEIAEEDWDEYGQGIDSSAEDLIQTESYQGSDPKPLGGIYELFSNVLKKKDVTRISNLNKEELGNVEGISSVRGNLFMQILGNRFGHSEFGSYFGDVGRMIGETSLSKEGFLLNTFVTSKKFATRETSSNIKNLDEPQKKKKWSMFSGK